VWYNAWKSCYPLPYLRISCRSPSDTAISWFTCRPCWFNFNPVLISSPSYYRWGLYRPCSWCRFVSTTRSFCLPCALPGFQVSCRYVENQFQQGGSNPTKNPLRPYFFKKTFSGTLPTTWLPNRVISHVVCSGGCRRQLKVEPKPLYLILLSQKRLILPQITWL
jgi:hypothetical protein